LSFPVPFLLEGGALLYVLPSKTHLLATQHITYNHNHELKAAVSSQPSILHSKMATRDGRFTFATALDLNMGYYHIRLDPS
jgi:hypothetical protein